MGISDENAALPSFTMVKYCIITVAPITTEPIVLQITALLAEFNSLPIEKRTPNNANRL